MKILLLAVHPASRTLIHDHITSAGHIVVGCIDSPDELIHVIARTSPHLLVAQALDASKGQLLGKELQVCFPELSLCLFCGELCDKKTDWREALNAALAAGIKPEVPFPYADNLSQRKSISSRGIGVCIFH